MSAMVLANIIGIAWFCKVPHEVAFITQRNRCFFDRVLILGHRLNLNLFMLILSGFTFVIVDGSTQGAELGQESARPAAEGARFLGEESGQK